MLVALRALYEKGDSYDFSTFLGNFLVITPNRLTRRLTRNSYDFHGFLDKMVDIASTEVGEVVKFVTVTTYSPI